jgi:hypothetical protein
VYRCLDKERRILEIHTEKVASFSEKQEITGKYECPLSG